MQHLELFGFSYFTALSCQRNTIPTSKIAFNDIPSLAEIDTELNKASSHTIRQQIIEGYLDDLRNNMTNAFIGNEYWVQGGSSKDYVNNAVAYFENIMSMYDERVYYLKSQASTALERAKDNMIPKISPIEPGTILVPLE